jgi:hypothetical protein
MEMDELNEKRTKYYRILRLAEEPLDIFWLRVFNEAMLWKVHLISVDVSEFCVDIEYTNL